MSIGNIIIGQSGGPTSAINASLAGVFKAARDHGANKIFGMRNGIEGLIEGRHIDLQDYIGTETDIELLKRTPASFLGTCRYKLGKKRKAEEDFEQIFSHLKHLDVKSFFYTGGNDSMDTVNQLSIYAESINSDIRFIGVPKTIDNDLVITDHTPGYGSAAKYVAAAIKEIALDAYAYNENTVVIIEIMGRDTGWLTAASLLAAGEDNPGPDIILLPEVLFDEEQFLSRLKEILNTKKTVIIAVSEGIRNTDGRYVSEQTSNQDNIKDPFGHVNLTGSALYLKRLITRTLNPKRTRAIEFSSVQRCAAHISSLTDINEAFFAGNHAVKAAANGETAKMVTLNRVSDEPYSITYSTSNASDIANGVKPFPLEWYNHKNFTVHTDFLNYARPLILGELAPIMVNGLPRHLVVK